MISINFYINFACLCKHIYYIDFYTYKLNPYSQKDSELELRVGAARERSTALPVVGETSERRDGVNSSYPVQKEPASHCIILP